MIKFCKLTLCFFEKFYAPSLTLFEAVLPAHATGDIANMPQWDYNWHPIGTEPFKLVDWIAGDQLILEPNENYRDYPEKPLLDKLLIRIIPSREIGKILLGLDDIDILWDLREANVSEFTARPEVVVHRKPSPAIERLVLNLADPQVHQESYFASWQIPTEARGAGFNFSPWIDAAFDEAITVAGSTPDLDKRRVHYQAAMEALATGRFAPIRGVADD